MIYFKVSESKGLTIQSSPKKSSGNLKLDIFCAIKITNEMNKIIASSNFGSECLLLFIIQI